MEVERQAAGLVARWPTLSPGWLPRTQEPIKASLAGGRVLLSARVDLAIGRPAVKHASVGIVELKSGKRRAEHRADLHFYALIEALRSPAPPFMVATYYSRTGELDVEPVSEDLLAAAARRTIAAAEALYRLAAGAEPNRTPNPLCGWCDALPTCEPGQERTGTSIPFDRSGGPSDGSGSPTGRSGAKRGSRVTTDPGPVSEHARSHRPSGHSPRSCWHLLTPASTVRPARTSGTDCCRPSRRWSRSSRPGSKWSSPSRCFAKPARDSTSPSARISPSPGSRRSYDAPWASQPSNHACSTATAPRQRPWASSPTRRSPAGHEPGGGPSIGSPGSADSPPAAGRSCWPRRRRGRRRCGPPSTGTSSPRFPSPAAPTTSGSARRHAPSASRVAANCASGSPLQSAAEAASTVRPAPGRSDRPRRRHLPANGAGLGVGGRPRRGLASGSRVPGVGGQPAVAVASGTRPGRRPVARCRCPADARRRCRGTAGGRRQGDRHGLPMGGVSSELGRVTQSGLGRLGLGQLRLSASGDWATLSQLRLRPRATRREPWPLEHQVFRQRSGEWRRPGVAGGGSCSRPRVSDSGPGAPRG